MFFGPGKRKGYSSFQVVDRSTKSQKAIAKLPSTLPLEQEGPRVLNDQEEEIRAEFEDDDRGDHMLHCLPDAQKTAAEKLGSLATEPNEVLSSNGRLCTSGMRGERL